MTHSTHDSILEILSDSLTSVLAEVNDKEDCLTGIQDTFTALHMQLQHCCTGVPVTSNPVSYIDIPSKSIGNEDRCSASWHDLQLKIDKEEYAD